LGIISNGVEFKEASPDSPVSLSVTPGGESRMSIAGWFDWQDIVTQRASKAFLGWAQVATGYNFQGAGLEVPGNYPYLNLTLPYAHADWNPGGRQMFLADGFEQVKGSVPNLPSIGPNQTSTFDEAYTVIHFRSPKDGYRVLPDSFVVDPKYGTPREYYLNRLVEIQEQQTSFSQSIPHQAGLQWVFQGVPNQNCAAAAYVSLHKGEITLKIYPWPIEFYNEAAFTNLIGKTNAAPFPPPPPNLPGIPTTPSLMKTKAAGTLVMGQPSKRIIRQADCSYALELTLKMVWFPCGSNAFFAWNPPPAARGRIRIEASGAPVSDPTLGGPGYYPVQRPGNDSNPPTNLFPSAPFAAAFVPPGTALGGIPNF